MMRLSIRLNHKLNYIDAAMAEMLLDTLRQAAEACSVKLFIRKESE